LERGQRNAGLQTGKSMRIATVSRLAGLETGVTLSALQ